MIVEPRRTANSLKNIATGWGFILVATVMGFVTRTVFNDVLGKTYLGLNSVLTNVLTMLSLTELGLGTAIVFSLYKPLAEHDTEAIKTLMQFYKRAYRVIGLVVAGLGLALMPFLPLFIKEHASISNLYVVYSIYLFNSAYTYFFSYKRALMSANQKGYRVTIITTVTKLLINALQITVLLTTGSFIGYLLMQTIVSFAENLYVNAFIDRRNPFLRDPNVQPLAPETLKGILTNVKALVWHKLGDFFMNSTDNLIVAGFLSLNYVGMLGNYSMIVVTLNSFVSNLFTGLSASLGHLVAKENEEKRLQVFNIMVFVSMWVYGAIAIALVCLLSPVVNLWMGPDYLLGRLAVITLAGNFYLLGLRIPFLILKNAAGIYKEDKFVPIVQSVVNVGMSVALAGPLGVGGVLLGTTIANLSLPMWYRPILVYRMVFGRSSREYFRKTLVGSAYVLAWALVSFGACQMFQLENLWLDALARLAIAIVPANALALAVFGRRAEFRAVLELLQRVLRRLRRNA